MNQSGGIIGEMAHLHAYQKDGPRGNDNLSEKDRNSYHNLILLCPNHHTEIDNDSTNWTTTRLLNTKKRHEEWIRDALTRTTATGNLVASSKCLFVLSGPSAAGKDVIIHRLIRKLEGKGRSATNLRRYTTRPPRPDDVSDIPFNYLSSHEFNKKVERKEIACVHSSLGQMYGCDSSFSEESPEGAAVFYSMRVYSALPEIKKQAEHQGINVRNILITADDESIRSRILMRSSNANEKVTRIDKSLDDIAWLNREHDFVTGFFDISVSNSDTSKLRDTVERIHQYIENTFTEINELKSWWNEKK
ncbi:MAG: hypothetical protein GY928_30215 [Colwellia sp.]|nr:hypothetical protein [Colwellia sp.]